MIKYLQVTWIEHTEYNENLVHEWYRSLIKAGMAFGAQRWIASLQRQHHFLKMMKSAVDPTGNNNNNNGFIYLFFNTLKKLFIFFIICVS